MRRHDREGWRSRSVRRLMSKPLWLVRGICRRGLRRRCQRRARVCANAVDHGAEPV
jgi:hypothetical protein